MLVALGQNQRQCKEGGAAGGGAAELLPQLEIRVTVAHAHEDAAVAVGAAGAVLSAEADLAKDVAEAEGFPSRLNRKVAQGEPPPPSSAGTAEAIIESEIVPCYRLLGPHRIRGSQVVPDQRHAHVNPTTCRPNLHQRTSVLY